MVAPGASVWTMSAIAWPSDPLPALQLAGTEDAGSVPAPSEMTPTVTPVPSTPVPRATSARSAESAVARRRPGRTGWTILTPATSPRDSSLPVGIQPSTRSREVCRRIEAAAVELGEEIGRGVVDVDADVDLAVAFPEVGGGDEVRPRLGGLRSDHATELGVETYVRGRGDRGRGGGEGRGRGGNRQDEAKKHDQGGRAEAGGAEAGHDRSGEGNEEGGGSVDGAFCHHVSAPLERRSSAH